MLYLLHYTYALIVLMLSVGTTERVGPRLSEMRRYDMYWRETMQGLPNFGSRLLQWQQTVAMASHRGAKRTNGNRTNMTKY